MRERCACHGSSGSCSLKTCWAQTPDIRIVGEIIKRLYHDARKLEISNA